MQLEKKMMKIPKLAVKYQQARHNALKIQLGLKTPTNSCFYLAYFK